jgi:antitoxin MazE
MRSQVQKWGNSLAIRIPKAFAEEVGLEANAAVDLSLAEGKLVIAPVTRARFALEELLDRVSDENRHAELETGPAVGREAW